MIIAVLKRGTCKYETKYTETKQNQTKPKPAETKRNQIKTKPIKKLHEIFYINVYIMYKAYLANELFFTSYGIKLNQLLILLRKHQTSVKLSM